MASIRRGAAAQRGLCAGYHITIGIGPISRNDATVARVIFCGMTIILNGSAPLRRVPRSAASSGVIAHIGSSLAGAGEGPLPTDQVNLTDEDADHAGGGRRVRAVLQRQAAVAADSLLVVAADVVQAPNDKHSLSRCCADRRTACRTWQVGELLADNGYFSEGT